MRKCCNTKNGGYDLKRQFEQEYDRIASSRLSRLDGGLRKKVALGNLNSIRFDFKMKRLGLSGEHIDNANQLVDEISINELLSSHTIGVRFATIPRAKRHIDIWNITD